jgi:Ax21 family sulfation-dependent quorum factor
MKRSLLALALSAVLPMSAQAANVSYSSLELDYVNIDSDANGLALRGSVSLGETNLYGFGAYSKAEINSTNVKIDNAEIGLGYHHELNSNTDLLVEAAFQRADAGAIAVNGYRVSGGVRALLTDDFEGLAKLNYEDTNNSKGDFSATLGGQYKFSETWGVNAEVEFANGGHSFLLGLRANF